MRKERGNKKTRNGGHWQYKCNCRQQQPKKTHIMSCHMRHLCHTSHFWKTLKQSLIYYININFANNMSVNYCTVTQKDFTSLNDAHIAAHGCHTPQYSSSRMLLIYALISYKFYFRAHTCRLILANLGLPQAPRRTSLGTIITVHSSLTFFTTTLTVPTQERPVHRAAPSQWHPINLTQLSQHCNKP